MIRTSNVKARALVEKLQEFNGSNTFARNVNGAYVVYSHGEHYPMFVFKDGEWFENSVKYSPTTSKHMWQLRPYCVTIFKKTTQELKEMIYG